MFQRHCSHARRFDILLVLHDCRNPQWDRIVSDHVLASHAAHGAATAAGSHSDGTCDGVNHASTAADASPWTLTLLQQYLLWAKQSFRPVLSPAAESVLLAYYQRLRQASDRHAARTTIRALESLIRVAQVGAAACAPPVTRFGGTIGMSGLQLQCLGTNAACALAGIALACALLRLKSCLIIVRPLEGFSATAYRRQLSRWNIACTFPHDMC